MNERARRRPWILVGALGAVLLLAGSFALQSAFGPSSAPTQTGQSTHGLLGDPDDEVARAVAEMQMIADAAAQAMAGAGASASAEYNATAEAAASLVGELGSEGERAVAAALEAQGKLEQAPEGFLGGNVSASPGAGDVEEIRVPQPRFEHDVESETPEGGSYEQQDASIRARAVLAIPSTGVAGIDAAALVVAQVYVSVKSNVTGNGTIILDDDTLGTLVFNDTEGLSHRAAPEEERAEAAQAHAEATLEKAWAAASSTWSGVNLTVEAQAELLAEVRAEINATIEAQAEAEAAVQAELEARMEATASAAAEAEAEAHAEAEQRIEAAHQAHLEAKQKVRAGAEQQVDLVYNKSMATADGLEAQAAAALSQADEASAQVWASAEATLEVLYAIENQTGTDVSAQARAITAAAAEAEAKARAQAQARADVLLRMAAMVRSSAELKAQAILTVSAQAEARLDAKLEFAVQATLRAEAYTVAKIRADAQARIVAHQAVAAKAVFHVQASAKGHIHAVLQAALGINAHAKIGLDGSQDLMQIVRADVDAGVTRDVEVIREIAHDFDERTAFDPEAEEKASSWHATADRLETEKDVSAGATYLVEDDIDHGYFVVAQTKKDLEFLGQQFL